MESGKSRKRQKHHRHGKSFWQKVGAFFTLKKKPKRDRPLIHSSIAQRTDADFTIAGGASPSRSYKNGRRHKNWISKFLTKFLSFFTRHSKQKPKEVIGTKPINPVAPLNIRKPGTSMRHRKKILRHSDSNKGLIQRILNFFIQLFVMPKHASRRRIKQRFAWLNRLFDKKAAAKFRREKRNTTQEDRTGRVRLDGAIFRSGVEVAPAAEYKDTSTKSRKKYIRLKKNSFLEKFFRRYRKPWHNFLYFLGLKASPFDPFMDADINKSEDSKIIRFQKYFTYSFNSAIIFIIAYIAAYLIYQFTVIITASFYNIDAVLFYYEVMFPIGDASPRWNAFNIIMITLSGPVVSLALGVVWYKLVLKKRDLSPMVKLFFVWLTFHSFNMFFGAFVAGVITNQGFGYVANWMFMGIVLKILFSMLALGALAYIGYRATGQFLATSNSVNRINKHNKDYFILAQGVIPWLVGSGILVLLKIPDKPPQHQNIIVYDLIIVGSFVFMVLATLIKRDAKPAVAVNSKRRDKTKLGWLYMLVAIGLIAFYRIALEPGLHFVIDLVFDVTFYR
jgi:hypothetical protein